MGFLATQLAVVLQGKDKPTYLPSRDAGDVCVVTNAAKIHFTGRKWDGKIYRWHTGRFFKDLEMHFCCVGYPGGLRQRTAKEVFAQRPEDILWRAVSGMLPKNHLQEGRLRKLLIFPQEHNLTEVDLVKWEVPHYMIKKLNRRQGKPAPKIKR